MVSTPLITKLKTNGGTLYTFTSTSKDLTRSSLDSSPYTFEFSHFACLNLPEIKSGSPRNYNHTPNTEDSKTLFEYIKSRKENENTYVITLRINEGFVDMVKSFYVRFVNNVFDDWVEMKKKDETTYISYIQVKTSSDLISNGNDYSFEFQAIIDIDGEDTLFNDFGVYKISTDYIGNDNLKGLYLENFEGYQFYNNDYNVAIAEHFQNYILNFETCVLNDKDFDVNCLGSPAERIFFNWLEKIGGIKFNDDTLNINKITESTNLYYEDSDEILDRTVQYIGDIDTVNLTSINGDSFNEVYLYIPANVGATNPVRFKKTNFDSNFCVIKDNYQLLSEKIIGRDNYKIENRPIDDISLDAIYDGDINGNYYRCDNQYGINFNVSDYIDAFKEISINKFQDINTYSFNNFEFNCILVYYDLIEKDKDGNEINRATNLYGVLFLDNFVRDDRNTSDESLAYINSFPKFRTSELDDGNSFSLKLDIKIDTAPSTTMYRLTKEDVLKDDSYVDFNTSQSFQLYRSALEELHKCVDIFQTQQREIYKLEDRVEELESMILNLRNANEIAKEIEILKFKLDSNVFVDTTQIMSLIDATNSRINNFFNNNNYPLNITTPLSFESGMETTIDNETGQIVVKNSLQNYNYVGEISLDIDNIKENYIYPQTPKGSKLDIVNIELQEFTNLILLGYNESSDIETSSDTSKEHVLQFVIGTENSKWKKGQSVDFIINNDNQFNFNKIKQSQLDIITNFNDKDILIKSISNEELQNMGDKIELIIVCLNNEEGSEKFITIIR